MASRHTVDAHALERLLEVLIESAAERVASRIGTDAAVVDDPPKQVWLRTQREGAAYLRMPRTAFGSYARQGRIRGHRLGRCWFYDTRELDEDMRALSTEAL